MQFRGPVLVHKPSFDTRMGKDKKLRKQLCLPIIKCESYDPSVLQLHFQFRQQENLHMVAQVAPRSIIESICLGNMSYFARSFQQQSILSQWRSLFSLTKRIPAACECALGWHLWEILVNPPHNLPAFSKTSSSVYLTPYGQS